jgi:phage FluMu protein Com
MTTVCLREYRCTGCKKLLFKGALVESVVEIRCRNCHTINTVSSSTFNELLCAVFPCPHRITVETAAEKSAH